MATTLETWSSGRPMDDPLTIEVRFPRRGIGGYRVVRADNGRDLGWVYHNPDGSWQGYASQAAFRGASLTDTGDVLDDVPFDLYGGVSTVENRPICIDRTRSGAAHGIFFALVHGEATAITGKPHPRVRCYERM